MFALFALGIVESLGFWRVCVCVSVCALARCTLMGCIFMLEKRPGVVDVRIKECAAVDEVQLRMWEKVGCMF